MSGVTQKRSHKRGLTRGEGGRRTDKAELVMAALLRGNRLIDVAADLGMAPSTLRDWMRADWFRIEYTAVKQQLLDGTINKLRSAGNDAVELLHKVVRNPKLATTPRVTAARGLLEVLLRAVETQELAARLERLEHALAQAEREERI